MYQTGRTLSVLQALPYSIIMTVLDLYQLTQKGDPRMLEWVAYPFSSRSSQARIFSTASGFFTNWAIREARDVGAGIQIHSSPWELLSALWVKGTLPATWGDRNNIQTPSLKRLKWLENLNFQHISFALKRMSQKNKTNRIIINKRSISA